MENEFKIEVTLNPHEWDNKAEPYFWCIYQWHTTWCNSGCGWSVSPEQAWKDAMEYYNKAYVNGD